MKTEPSQTNQFAVCLNNEGYEASLEVGKIYRVIPDETAEINSLIRVIDESGEDYAFSVNRFYPTRVTKAPRRGVVISCQIELSKSTKRKPQKLANLLTKIPT
jgi:hypothetical protein